LDNLGSETSPEHKTRFRLPTVASPLIANLVLKEGGC
jgi:hypothetical protein